MCGGMEVYAQGKTIRIYFPNPKAALPLQLRNGDVAWVPWGVRHPAECTGLPKGGWARLESVRAGKWARFAPRPVLINAERFVEKDAAGQSHWFDLEAGQRIQGLLAHNADGEQRVYVVTIDVPAQYANIHDRWPRLVATPQDSQA